MVRAPLGPGLDDQHGPIAVPQQMTARHPPRAFSEGPSALADDDHVRVDLAGNGQDDRRRLASANARIGRHPGVPSARDELRYRAGQ